MPSADMRRISVIICTSNRAGPLANTLAALTKVFVPDSWDVELLVVNNGSTDETAGVLREADLTNFRLRVLVDERKGKGNALNTGLAAASGEAIIFTDDDVIPARDWLTKLVTPLLEGECDAVAGRIKLADHLRRPWLSFSYARWLAATDGVGDDFELIGANMGIHRRVLEKVPGFDTNLAPGAIGLGEDTLFTWQLQEAGFQIKFIAEAVVEHHPDISRLLRSEWLRMAESHGRKDAYLLHHWKHGKINFPTFLQMRLRLKLFLRRLLEPPAPANAEGCAAWEMSYLGDIAMCKQYRTERRHAPRYSRSKMKRAN